MALAKKSRGGLSGWVAAALLALSLFAAVNNSPKADDGSSIPSLEASLED